ncbi:DUF4870 domain-containing protein [Aquimarina sp. 2201CG5-10]|uniref:DUF4870 domain-containing protein n=1 Tax=Aquimarina callyspongiae TaxID=3098150 RepID=UPI002AB53663|nr:DUF4870 domain-containing protein [Aquimarina sp. 2201CG5-10]MDY8137938.1 DUF4870 domain-containing protein [Aquimarina sp. 2201CG5-10]
MKQKDNSLIIVMHLSGLLTGVLGPLILWLTQRDKILMMEEHGKAAVNFQITALIYLMFAFVLGFMCCIGFFLIPFWFIYANLFPILNAVNASKEKMPYYPLSFKFIS